VVSQYTFKEAAARARGVAGPPASEAMRGSRETSSGASSERGPACQVERPRVAARGNAMRFVTRSPNEEAEDAERPCSGRAAQYAFDEAAARAHSATPVRAVRVRGSG